MNKWWAIIALAVALVPVAGLAAGGGVKLENAKIDLKNHEAIQRGGKYFVNYCMGCHSAQYVRYKQFTQVGLTEDDVRDNLMFRAGKVGDLMTISMPPEDGSRWFGAPPPDLTLAARVRYDGVDWIYTYLKSFYTDPSRPMGVNNTVFPNVGMPHVLWELQGIQDPVYRYDVHDEDGDVAESFDSEAKAEAYLKQHEGGRIERVVDHLKLVTPGRLKPAEYDQVARDLATYLAYISEPIKLERQRMGFWVILFLIFFSYVAYQMKKEWWKAIH